MPLYVFECASGHSTEEYFPGPPPAAFARAKARGVPCGRCCLPTKIVIAPFHTEERWGPREDIASGTWYRTARERDAAHKARGQVYIGREGGA